jgi:hypothetical protein
VVAGQDVPVQVPTATVETAVEAVEARAAHLAVMVMVRKMAQPTPEVVEVDSVTPTTLDWITKQKVVRVW